MATKTNSWYCILYYLFQDCWATIFWKCMRRIMHYGWIIVRDSKCRNSRHLKIVLVSCLKIKTTQLTHFYGKLNTKSHLNAYKIHKNNSYLALCGPKKWTHKCPYLCESVHDWIPMHECTHGLRYASRCTFHPSWLTVAIKITQIN